MDYAHIQQAQKEAQQTNRLTQCEDARFALAAEANNPAVIKREQQACIGLPPEASIAHQSAPKTNGTRNQPKTFVDLVNSSLEKTGLFGVADPDTNTLKSTFSGLNSADRIQLQKDYSAMKHESLDQRLAEKYGTTSTDYQSLKGMLLRTDSPISATAVNLHMALVSIRDAKIEQGKDDSAEAAGYANNMIHHHRLSPGFAGFAGAVGSMVSQGEISDKTKFAETTVAKLTPPEVSAIQKEHVRIFHRELGEMAQDTQGVSPELAAAFTKKGF